MTAIAWVARGSSLLVMHWVGRRTMIICGLTILMIMNLLIGALAYPAVHHKAAVWVQASITTLWLGVYSLTLSPQTFAIAAEISATRLRAQTISLARLFYVICTIVTNTAEPYLINPTAANLKGKTAFVWMATAFFTLLWAIFRLPETKGLTYDELDILFEKRVSAWRFSRKNIDLIRDTRNIKGVNGEDDKKEVIVDHREVA
jgi:SP family general alpha glucoside:H+ symporter-like MFS transporter